MPRMAIVFVSYRIPTARLHDHFRWNGRIYEAYGDQLRVYVVSDVEHELADYAETVVFPESALPVMGGQVRFSLCKTKNAGIAKAIQDGTNVIVSTDVDVAFDWGSLALTSAIGRVPADSAAVVPVYRMAPSYEERTAGRLDHGCTGTVGMTANNWRRIKYDERCIGYGADDGILLRDIELAGLKVIRDCEVAHIAHVQGDGSRTPGSGSDTCWGRADGFNFDNFHRNRQLHQARKPGPRIKRR